MADADELCFGLVICGYTIGIPFCNCCSSIARFDGVHLIQPVTKNLFLRSLIFILNIFLTPILLAIHSFRIYVYPCFAVGIGKLVCGLVFMCDFISCCFIHTDSIFPPDNTSLGDDILQRYQGKKIEWIRIQHLEYTDKDRKKGAVNRLFDGISPDDIAQGGLGDCWILAAIATLSDRPYIIQNCFKTKTFSKTGKYNMRLFDERKRKFVNITVDDYVPCLNGEPIFIKLTSNEAWPLLLEKAFAKLYGSYSKIEGGHPVDAMRAITGYEAKSFYSERNKFDDNLFKELQKFQICDCLMAAGSKGKDETLAQGRDAGTKKSTIVPGHAYSILDIKTPMLTTNNVRLLKLRNPWGTFTWDGDWSKNSSLWLTHPLVALNIGRKDDKSDDGVFYMSYEDFVKHFDTIDVIFPNTNMDSMTITITEKFGYCGPFIGCVAGCMKFWCLCRGIFRLWCMETSQSQKEKIEQKESGDCMC